MRLGIVLDLATTPRHQVAVLARRIEAAGVELLWLRPAADRPYEALAAAAACAPMLRATQVVAEVRVDGAHPIHLAEERNVVDQLLGGRLTVVLRSPQGDGALLAESVEVLLQAARTVPFAHDGPGFMIPAVLEANTVNLEERVIVTPPPLGLDPQVWVTGPGATQVASEFAISVVDEYADPVATWASLAERLGRGVLRLRRPAVRSWRPTDDAVEKAARLAGERDAWGMDCVVMDLGVAPTDPAWARAIADLQGVIRPRVQMQRLPPGLEDFWARELRAGPSSAGPSGAGPSTSERQ